MINDCIFYQIVASYVITLKIPHENFWKLDFFVCWHRQRSDEIWRAVFDSLHHRNIHFFILNFWSDGNSKRRSLKFNWKSEVSAGKLEQGINKSGLMFRQGFVSQCDTNLSVLQELELTEPRLKVHGIWDALPFWCKTLTRYQCSQKRRRIRDSLGQLILAPQDARALVQRQLHCSLTERAKFEHRAFRERVLF